MLFISRDAFLTSDAANGVGVQTPKLAPLAKNLMSMDHQYVQVVDRYRAVANDVTDRGGFMTAGYISDLTAAGAQDNQPWGYLLPVPYEARKSK